jgi:tetratricopeptide (TPR) repeat protein
MEEQLAELENAMTQSSSAAASLSDADRRVLESLGYAGGGGAVTIAVPGAALPDIKEMIGPFNRFREAVELTHEGRFDAAQPLLESVVAEVPGYFQAQFNLGICYARKQEFDKAAKCLRQALDLAGQNDPHVPTVLAKIYILQQQPEQAVPLLEQSLEIDPANPETHFFLGDAFRAMGRTDDARRQYLQALELNPAFAPAAEALRTLPQS